MTDELAFLYIEDHPASRKAMELLLCEVLGYEQLIMLGSSHDIVNEIENMEMDFNIVFMDLRLNPFNGYEVLSMLREHPTFNNMKVIAVTASTDASEIEKMQAAGFDGLLGKPLSHATFPIYLQRILSGETLWEVG